MKKTIFLAAIAAAFVSNAQAADKTFGQTCGHLDNSARFNPTELSAFQECWLDYHKADEAAGTLGSIFWARAGDDFVSMPVKVLHEARSKAAAKEIVVQKIIEEVVVERIVEVTVENGETIDRLRAEIRGYESARDAILENLGVEAGADALASIQGEIDRIQGEMIRLMGLPTFAQGEASVWSAINTRITEFNTQNGTTFATDLDSVADLEAMITDAVDVGGDSRVSELVTSLNNHPDIVATFNADTNAWTWDVGGVRSAGFTAGEGSARQDFIDDVNSFFGTSHATISETMNFLAGVEIEDGYRSTVTQRTGTNIFDVTGANAGVLYNRAYVDEAVSTSGVFIAANGVANGIHGMNIPVTRAELLRMATTYTTLDSAVRGMVRHVISQIPAPTLSFGTITSDPLNESNLDNYKTVDSSYTQASGSGVNMWRDGNGNYNLWDPRNPHVGPTGDLYSHFLGTSINLSVETLIEQAIESAYDAGYDEGYDDGYVDGYKDGFADGQSSITIN